MTQPDPRLDEIRHNLTIGNPAQAREILESYLADYPNDAEGWYLSGAAAADEFDAITWLEYALELDPEHYHAALLLAEITGETEVITPANLLDHDNTADN